MPDGTVPVVNHASPPASTARRRFVDGFTMFMVAVLALLLLAYVGFGAAQQRYARYIVAGATAQGEVVRNAIESSLRNGLLLRYYVGFSTLAKPILDADNGISALKVVDTEGTTVFDADDNVAITAVDALAALGREIQAGAGTVHTVRIADQIVIVMPLHNRFERVGYLIAATPTDVIDGRVRQAFGPLLYCALGLSVLFALSATFMSQAKRRARLPWAYALTFVVMAILVTGTMVMLYADGTRARTHAGGASIAQRLKDITTFNLSFDQFEGIDDVFTEAKLLDPDITAAGLIVNGVVRAHTRAGAVGAPWATDSRNFEYVIDIPSPPASGNQIQVAIAVPRQVVIFEVAGSIRDFAALFIASGFFAGLFFHFAGIMSDRSRTPAGSESEDADQTRSLELVRPLFFLAVFVEHLNYPFLPQYIVAMVSGTGDFASWSSAPFVGYYLAFALALIPGGWAAQRIGPKRLIGWGLALAASGLLGLFVTDQLLGLTAARVIAGIGQGLLFIGIQSYIVTNASARRRTESAAIIVFGFQGGMISGTAIGSLVVGYIGPSGVFLLSAGIALIVLVYAAVLLPSGLVAGDAPEGARKSMSGFIAELGRVLRPGDFLATIMLVGIPAKAVMTGVVLFGLPLLLTRKGFSNEAVGQLIMLYAIGVLVTSEWVSRLVDRTNGSRRALVWGGTLSGVGIVVIAAIGEAEGASESVASIVLIILGVGMVGIAHGLVNAPIITCIGETRIAHRIGAASATAAYRFLERLGHVAGPILVAQLFAVGGKTTIVLSWIGSGLVAFSILYLIFVGATRDGIERRAAS